MSLWLRYERGGRKGFGVLQGETIEVYEGDMFESPRATGERLALSEVNLLTPCVPGKMVALWNNFHALAAKLGLTEPAEALYFLKANNTFIPHNALIRKPASYAGKVVFEGELGIVIGKRCSAVSEADAARYIFGYTCVNDVTAVEIIGKDPTFAQWARAKGYDTFGPFGPVIATGLDPSKLNVRTVLNGTERQNYPVSDMIFSPARLVSLISQDMTLEPGDIISCGTSVGVGSMKPGSKVEVRIEGIGSLVNGYE